MSELTTQDEASMEPPVKRKKTSEEPTLQKKSAIATASTSRSVGQPAFPHSWHKVVDSSYSKQVFAIYFLPSTAQIDQLNIKNDPNKKVIKFNLDMVLPLEEFYRLFRSLTRHQDEVMTQELSENSTLTHRFVEIEIPWPEHSVKFGGCSVHNSMLGVCWDKIQTHAIEDVAPIIQDAEES